MANYIKCGKCIKVINDNISASIRCNKCELWIHKKCTGLSTNEFSKILNTGRKQPHKWVCEQCTNRDNCQSPKNKGELENITNKKQQYTSFQCCKTHAFLHYVCIKCFNIYHKKCLARLPENVIHISGHKINCCGDHPVNIEECICDSSVLEKTIAELTEESEQKSYHLKKLKKEKDILIQESLDMEATFEQQVQKQKAIIKELESCIRALEKKSEFKSTGTQTLSTSSKTKNQSTNTEKQQQVSTSMQTDLLWEDLKISKMKDQTQQIANTSSEGNLNEDVNLRLNVNINRKIPQHKILILGDECGKYVATYLKKHLNDYAVTAIIKPHAAFENVTFDIEKHTNSFGKDDFVCIIAGKNNFRKKNFISFKSIKTTLAACSNTNIIISSVPYMYCPNKNFQIYRHNNELFKLISRLNSCTKHNLIYYEINNENYNYSKCLISTKLSTLILESKKTQNLVFIETTEINCNDVLIESNKAKKSEGNFLEQCTHLTRLI